MTVYEDPTLEKSSVFRIAVGIAVLFLSGLAVGTLVSVRSSEASNAEAEAPAGPSAATLTRSSLDEAAASIQTVQDISDARRTPTVVAAFRVGPSVVSVRTVRTVRQRPSMFDRFFGETGGTRVVPGLGSGFVIDDAGTIITNQHVVRDAEEILVIDADGQSYDAALVGEDELTDIAVIRIQGGVIPPAPIGTSSDIFVGEPAIAIGNPSGFALQNTEATVTSGVISGVGRDIKGQSGDEVLYADMLQTDASINPGNSGGPLVNAEGEVIGVNSSIFSRSGGSEGLGFAIPIDRAVHVAGELIEFGRVRRPWVGVNVVTTRPDASMAFGRPIVEDVYEGTPGETSGLRPGDEIVSLNGREVHHDLDWRVGLVDAGVGSVVQVAYRRDGTEGVAEIELAEIPSASATRVEVLTGLGLITVNQQIQQERNLPVEFGALVVSVDAFVAQQTRLQVGDVIFGINGTEVRTAEEAGELFGYYARGGGTDGWVRVYIARGNRRGNLDFRVG